MRNTHFLKISSQVGKYEVEVRTEGKLHLKDSQTRNRPVASQERLSLWAEDAE